MSATNIYLGHIEARIYRVDDVLASDQVSNARLMHLLAQSQSDTEPLLAALRRVISFLDEHERSNALGREQWNDDIRVLILRAVSKASA